jgi:hypothetical protein
MKKSIKFLSKTERFLFYGLITIFISVAIFVLIVYSLFNWNERNSNNNKISTDTTYINNFTKFMNLKYIDSSNFYNSSTLNIVNDTLISSDNKFISKNSTYEAKYFVQSLKNPTFKKVFKAGNWYVGATPLDYYKDGFIYTNSYGSSYINKIGIDGTYEAIFSLPKEKIANAKRVFFYKDLSIIVSMYGVFVFDTQKQKLLWDQIYYDKGPQNINSALLGKKFIFTQDAPKRKVSGFENIEYTCLDLESLKVTWKQTFALSFYDFQSNNPGEYKGSIGLIKNNKIKNILINEYNSFTIIDVTNGKTFFKYPIPIETEFKWSAFIDSNRVYIQNKDTLKCFDFYNNKFLWQKEGLGSSYVFDKYLIAAVYNSNKFNLFYDKQSGKLKHYIKCYNNPDITILNNYVIIDNKIYSK